MRVPGPSTRERAAVSTVIGTLIFIVAALSIFTALATTNVAGMNYQNAAQQAANRNAIRSQELVTAAPVYDTTAYAEFSAESSAADVDFGMSYAYPVDWAEAALAVNRTGRITLMQHYTNACPGSVACELTLTYPPALNDTLVVGVSVANAGSSLAGAVGVRDSQGLYMTLRSLSTLQSGGTYVASEIWTSTPVRTGSDAHTVTVSVYGGAAPDGTFSIFVYDIAAGRTPQFTPAQGSGMAPDPISAARVSGQHRFFLAVVTSPNGWQAMAAPGFMLEASPPLPTEVALTSAWAATTVFASVIYVYHTFSGGSYTPALGEYVEGYDPASGTCGASGGAAQLPSGMTCTYAVSSEEGAPGLSRPFNLTDPGQKLSMGFTTTLGNTFWYNYTGYVAANLGPGSNAGYPYVPDVGDLINTVVAKGLGPAKLTFPAFTYYWNGGGAGGLGSGFLVNGYFGFAVPSGASLVWEVNVTNFDPQQRGITVFGPSELTLVAASSGASPTVFPIVGAMSDSRDDQAVTADAFAPVYLGYKDSGVLRFSSSNTKTPIAGAYMAEIVLVGSYDGNVPFAQILPVSATFVMGASLAGSNGAWCKAGTGTQGSNCDYTYPSAKGDPRLAAGGTYTFQVKGFDGPTSVYLLTTPSGSVSPNFADITGTLRSPSAVSFTVPAGTAPGFYEVDVTDGLNRLSVTVQVVP